MRSKIQPLGAAASRKHGVRALAVCKPERWPEPLRGLYVARCAELEAMPHLADVRFRGVCKQVAFLELLAAAAREWLVRSGLVDAAGNPNGLVAFALSLENSLSRAYMTAGLAPNANKRYVVQAESLLSALAGIEEAETESSTEGSNGDAKR